MLRKFVMAGIALVLGSASALAADLPTKYAPAPAPAPEFNWTGFYLGVGYGYLNGSVTGPGTVPFNVGGAVSYFEVNGGYRVQTSSNIVLGLDVSAPVWLSQSTFHVPPPGAGFNTAAPQYLILPEAQIGYAFGRFLPYFGVGVGLANVKATITPVAGTPLSDTTSSAVLAVTFGVDYALTNNWIVGVRYDHVQGELHNYTFNTAGAPTVVQVGTATDGISGIVRYKF
jgi:outer membrane immunogenic protein